MAPQPPRFQYKLFVSSATEFVGLRLELLQQELSAVGNGPVQLERIDVREDPRQARDWGVVLTPILIRVSPIPQRRVFGDLQGRALQLLAAPSAPEVGAGATPVSSAVGQASEAASRSSQ